MKPLTVILTVFSTITLFLSSGIISAKEFDSRLLNFQQPWTIANYTLVDDEQEAAFEQLLFDVQKMIKIYPDQAQTWLWGGIIKSSYAGAKGGLGALSLAKAAKKDLEMSLELDENLLDGSAYASLGILYHKVPGWPIGFGDDDLAEKMLIKALAIDPKGIDINYFYGEYLYDEGKYNKAQQHLLIAQNAPPRDGWQMADLFRQKEIASVLAKVQKKLRK